MHDVQEIIHVEHLKNEDFEDLVLMLGLKTEKNGSGVTGLTIKDAAELVLLLQNTRSPALKKLRAFLDGALIWAWRNEGKVSK